MLLCCSRNSLQIQFSSFSSLLLFGKREEGVIEFFQDFTFSENLCHLQTFFRGFSNARLKVLIKLPFMIFLNFKSGKILCFLQRKFSVHALQWLYWKTFKMQRLSASSVLPAIWWDYMESLKVLWTQSDAYSQSTLQRMVYAMPLCGLCVQKVYFDFMHNSNQF